MMKKLIICLAVLAMVFTMVSCQEEEKSFLVTFDTKGGSEVTNNIVVEGGVIDGVIEAKKTIQEGYAFRGWFSDPECTTLWVEGTPITCDTTLYAGWDNAFVTFSSGTSFTVTPNGTWEGTIEFSYDGYTWEEVTSGTEIPVTGKKVYVRGYGNTVVTGAENKTWTFTQSVYCDGDIRALLKHETVADPFNEHESINGEEENATIIVANDAFNGMFKGAEIKSIPYMEEVIPTGTNCFKEMFMNCTKLKVSLTNTEGSKKFVNVNYEPDTVALNMFAGCNLGTNVVATPSTGIAYYVTTSTSV